MKPLIQLVWDICLLRKGPQHMPHNMQLLLFVGIIHWLLGCWQISFQHGWQKAWWQSLVLMSITAVFSYVVLTIRGFQARFLQTLASLYLASILINLFVVPLFILHPFITSNQLPQFLAIVISFLVLAWIFALNIWSLIVTTHIYRHSLNVHIVLAFLTTMALVGINILVFTRLLK